MGRWRERGNLRAWRSLSGNDEDLFVEVSSYLCPSPDDQAEISHILSIIGVAIFFGIWYVMSALTFTGMQMFLALAALFVVYSATAFW